MKYFESLSLGSPRSISMALYAPRLAAATAWSEMSAPMRRMS